MFSLLPRVLERTGTSAGPGAITGLYTILVEGDDMSDPVADAVRAILDGHIILSRDLAARNQFPAIDVIESTSRVMRDVVAVEHLGAARAVTELIATYRRNEDLITLGAYKPGTNAKLDRAVSLMDAITGYLKQDIDERCSLAESRDALMSLAQSAA